MSNKVLPSFSNLHRHFEGRVDQNFSESSWEHGTPVSSSHQPLTQNKTCKIQNKTCKYKILRLLLLLFNR